MHEWDFAFLIDQRHFILQGLLGTLRLAVVSLVAGTVIGLVGATARLSGSAILRAVGTGYVEFFRNIPVLVQIFWLYFSIPILTGVQPNAYAAAAIATSLYAGAYLTEVFRSGIASIEKGQWDGARAVGFGHGMTMRYVVLPQAFRRVLPAFTNQVLEIVKTTSVASTIAYAELLYSAKLLSEQEFRPIEAYTAVGAAFILVLLPTSAIAGLMERRLARHG
ncbi:amino acid ABC transporter permease [Plastoroseomonas hellenica]|uniref:amino acid ABC transporter permease n=1 Tax=Plastoroseomonas hellenica TaxID=2687306 RepID=UPI001BA85F6D|nr:amino acid ABC transporter permease [Plastoroseomonas hellenica]MBR0642344.1 amino acid ABC transporter permease [Plastoroseomonas hellenica]